MTQYRRHGEYSLHQLDRVVAGTVQALGALTRLTALGSLYAGTLFSLWAWTELRGFYLVIVANLIAIPLHSIVIRR